MLILGTPHNPKNYIATNNQFATALQQMGFHPKYRDGEIMYFKKTPELEEILKNMI